ncbi:MAG: hypothetical protein AAFV77_06835 [Planctomycetota bacterium]
MSERRLLPIYHSTFHDAGAPVGEVLNRLSAVWAPREVIGEAYIEE